MSFNPLPSHEGRPFWETRSQRSTIFQSTSLSRGKTLCRLRIPDIGTLSIHFPLTREDSILILFILHFWLSIHFPLTREDPYGTQKGFERTSFNPLPSHEGRHFQNTQYRLRHTFNPLPSHEGRHTNGQTTTYTVTFQSTSLSRGKTDSRLAFPTSCAFQSTSLSRGKTCGAVGRRRG